MSAGCSGKPRQFRARTYNNRFKSRAGRAGTKTCRLLRIVAYMFLPLKRGVMRRRNMEALNKKLALLLWAQTDQGEDDVALFHGTLVSENEKYIFKRSEPPHPTIQDNWLHRIQPVSPELAEVLGEAEFTLSLTVGSCEESDLDFSNFGLKWPH